MKHLRMLAIIAACASAGAMLGAAGSGQTAQLSKQVAPILARCQTCHSGATAKEGLDLATRESAVQGGASGSALTPGDASGSLLYKLVAAKKMPPKAPLTDAEIAIVKQWIEGGAPWPSTVAGKSATPARSTSTSAAPPVRSSSSNRAGLDWWSLRPIKRVTPPVIETAGVSNPIDAFILAKLRSAGICEARSVLATSFGKPAATTDRVTLIRRATFDLHGLPPTPEEIDAFVHDQSPRAYEKLLDRLLASPRYGERWGRHWLDVVRYGESQGFERDKIRDHAWRYRDYVINSFNADQPYPQFVKEQLAGDVLEPITRDGTIATGFLVCGPWDEVGNEQQGQVMKRRVREEELEDMISAVSQTFLGMTVNCARCHDHKFDPIPQRDYYRLKAALDGVLHGNRPILTPPEMQARDERIAELAKRIRDLENERRAIEQRGRARVLAARGQTAVAGAPLPIAQWSFDGNADDTGGKLHADLRGGAIIALGRLRLNGRESFAITPPLPYALREKTLEAWVALANLQQRGGGVLTIEADNGRLFDGIVFGERESGKWIAGSSFFQRTRDLVAPVETMRPNELVHMAIAYRADNSIAVYRNGQPYGEPYTQRGDNAVLQTYNAGNTRVLLGLRHTGSNGFLVGEIEEARLYDRALTAEEVAASFKAGVNNNWLRETLAALTDDERRQHAAFLEETRRERDALIAVSELPMVYAASPRQPPPTFVLARGEVEKPGEQVAAGGLSCVQTPSSDLGVAPDAPEGMRRLRLAEWIASEKNPLTARVMVNRLWHFHFGRGLVGTPSDFGFNGERPSHPELLDWLASEFIARGWRMKAMHRIIMTSATYRQGSNGRVGEWASGRNGTASSALPFSHSPTPSVIDSDNKLLWHFPLHRLEGEVVRDAMLMASGQINFESSGPGFRPFTVFINNSHFYTLTDPTTPEFNRRTVYRINVGSARSPLLDSLDCPEPSVKTPTRSSTTTPLQALGLMNNSFVLRQSRCFAERVRKEAVAEVASQVSLAYRLAFGRSPTKDESTRAVALAREHGLEQVCWALLNASEFVYVR